MIHIKPKIPLKQLRYLPLLLFPIMDNPFKKSYPFLAPPPVCSNRYKYAGPPLFDHKSAVKKAGRLNKASPNKQKENKQSLKTIF